MAPYDGNVLIAGATGFIGTHLTRYLPHVRVLSRNASRATERFASSDIQITGGVYEWDPATKQIAPEILDGIDAVINLAGVSVAQGRWTRSRKASILKSRLDATGTIVTGLNTHTHNVRSLISASAVGYYGTCADTIIKESHTCGTDFLAEVCKQWESATAESPIRVAIPRIGIVLGPDGGALPKMALPFKFYVGGKLGSGSNWMPWIHIDDLVGIFNHLLSSDFDGPCNATAPNPETNATFTKALAQALNRPALFPVPRFMLRLLVGEFTDALFASQRTDAFRIISSGFEFRFPEIREALANIYGR